MSNYTARQKQVLADADRHLTRLDSLAPTWQATLDRLAAELDATADELDQAEAGLQIVTQWPTI